MVDFRQSIPADHPLSKMFSGTDQKRVENELDDIFNFDESRLERDDIDVSRGSKGAAIVEPAGFLEDDLFSEFTDSAKESDVLGYDPMGKENFARSKELSTPRPIDVHLNRPEDVAQNDSERKARVTTDPQKYANAPSSYDYPFVDTPQEFKDEFGDKSWEELEEKAGDDDVFRY